MMDDYKIIKYPRTPHLEGSRLQPGDEDLSQIPFSSIAGREIVVEEKCDGANSAVSFDGNGNLLLQSRGHYLTGGYRERHYDLLKQWVSVHRDALYRVLGNRYVMYGEWLYAKHTVYYDALPHYFLEFDMLDRETDAFLDTPSRHEMLSGLPVVSAPVLKRGAFSSLSEMTRLLGPSNYIREGHIDRLRAYCLRAGEDSESRSAETDPSIIMEGLYIKLEEDGFVKERMKYVRASFLQGVAESETHWLNRPIIPNQLRYPLEALFSERLPDGNGTAP